jgi:hypothetical protein
MAMASMWVGLLSCGSERTVSTASPASASGIDKYMLAEGDIRYGDAGTDQEGLIVGGKRSQYEGRKQAAFGGEISAGEYGRKDYRASDWEGTKKARSQSYTDTKDGKRFQFSSLFGSRQANETSKGAAYDSGVVNTARYGAGAAVEAGGRRLDKPSDARTDFRREVFPEPPKRSLREHQEMTVDETNSLLGR